MEFSKIIKQIRKENNLTQEELANKINVSRQAVSNWENNKNLPDIEMLISIAKIFSISLDELILGGKEMTKIEEKLIKDGSENKRAKMYMISNVVGLIFGVLGVMLIMLKGLTVEYIDDADILHENFFLLPIGFLFILIGIVTIVIGLIYYYKKTNDKFFTLKKIGYILSITFLFLTLLIYANSNKISIVSIIITLVGIGVIVFEKVKNR